MSAIDYDADGPSTSAGAAKGDVLTSAEIKRLWTSPKVRDRLGTVGQCIEFAKQNGLLLRSKFCRKHRMPMVLERTGNFDLCSFRCRKGKCRANSSISRAKGNSIDGPCLSRRTITDWYSYCREAVVIYQVDKEEDVGKIGGPGKIVQIDESKFGKRKFNKGRRVEGHRVLGMIEDGGEDLRLEVCPDNVRSAEVLIPLIRKHVAEGSIIRTDYWKAYDCISGYGYEHQKVNHSDPDNPFVASDGTYTQKIESQWRVVKHFFHKDNFNNPSNFADLVVEFLWRKSISKNREDAFLKLIEAIKKTYTP